MLLDSGRELGEVVSESLAAVDEEAARRIEELRPGIKAIETVNKYFQETKAEGRLTVRELVRLADVPYGTARRTLHNFAAARVLLLTPGHGRDPDVFTLPISEGRSGEPPPTPGLSPKVATQTAEKTLVTAVSAPGRGG